MHRSDIFILLKFQDSDDEDYFAEILKDDIIKLDETSLSKAPDIRPMIASTSDDSARRSQQPSQENIPNVSNVQGSANRRVKLRWRKAYIPRAKATEPVDGEISIEKLTSPKSEESPKHLSSLFSLRTANLRLIYATFLILILTLLALFLSLVGGESKPVKYFKYATFC